MVRGAWPQETMPARYLSAQGLGLLHGEHRGMVMGLRHDVEPGETVEQILAGGGHGGKMVSPEGVAR